MAAQLRSAHKLPVTYIALDWHQMDKELGSANLVEAFWTQLSAVLPKQVGAGVGCGRRRDAGGIRVCKGWIHRGRGMQLSAVLPSQVGWGMCVHTVACLSPQRKGGVAALISPPPLLSLPPFSWHDSRE
jgi:hypothetical protein